MRGLHGARPPERSRDFRTAGGLLRQAHAPSAVPTLAVLRCSVLGIAIGVIGPRILGHATDLLFNGVITPAARGYQQGTGDRRGRRARRQRSPTCCPG